MRNLLKLAIALCLTIRVQLLDFLEQMENSKDMFAGETNVRVLTDATIDEFLKRDTPVFLSFTKLHCRSCLANEESLMRLADSYKNKGKKIDVAVICILDHGEVVHRYHVHDIPDNRLYYKGMFHRLKHAYSDHFIHEWIQEYIDLKQMIKFTSPVKFTTLLDKSRHALIWYGEPFEKLDKRYQELLRMIKFKFGHDFLIFVTQSEQVALESG
jgi:hypothetical protein